MGFGDELLGTGFARGAKARGKRIAFGDGKRIIWNHLSEQIFKGNPNIAPPGSENDRDIEWHPFCRGNRIYNRQVGDRWEWNYSFRPILGEVFFTPDEIEFGKRHGSGFVVIEPNMQVKGFGPNKQWTVDRYDAVANKLASEGHRIRQFYYGAGHRLAAAEQIKTPSFRHAARILKNAALYIGPEGGLHHASAAVGIPAVVLFGGFIPPGVTGYGTHTNLAAPGTPCGSLSACEHCKAAMASISVGDVMDAARAFLSGAKSDIVAA